MLPHFSPDGSRITYVEEAAWASRGLYRMFIVPARGGPPAPFQPEFGTWPGPSSPGPLWSPDGRFLLFAGARIAGPGPGDWWVAPADGGPAVPTGAVSGLPRIDALQSPVAWVGRHVLVAAGSTPEGVNLYRARISPGDWKVTGPLEPLTSGTGMTHEAAVASDGRMVIPRINWVIQLFSIDRTARDGSPAPTPTALTHDGSPKFGPVLARDAARLAFAAFSGSRGQRKSEVRLQDLASGEESAPIQASGPSLNLSPQLSADGALVSWEDAAEGKVASFVARSGESAGREICRGCNVLGFFSDSRRVLARVGPTRLVRRDLQSATETPLLELEAGAILDADLSWDDRWLAVLLGRTDGTVAIEVRSADGRAAAPNERAPVVESPRFLSSLRWAPDGSRLYFLANRDGFRCIWAQALDPATKKPRGEPFAVFHAHRNPWRLGGPRSAFSFAVGRDRIVFNAAEITGNVLMGQLPLD
jgi:hypothetical protein